MEGIHEAIIPPLQYMAATPLEKGVSGYLSLFCLTEQLLRPFLSPSSCLGNNQSRVAEAWRREMYSGGVVGNYKGINSMSSLPP